ncbi:MAG: Predicted L-lactate dehydrogenase, hypothetical protein subunit YkgG, partial [uncultured Nocardioidaceae bacterium]
ERPRRGPRSRTRGAGGCTDAAGCASGQVRAPPRGTSRPVRGAGRRLPRGGRAVRRGRGRGAHRPGPRRCADRRTRGPAVGGARCRPGRRVHRSRAGRPRGRRDRRRRGDRGDRHGGPRPRSGPGPSRAVARAGPARARGPGRPGRRRGAGGGGPARSRPPPDVDQWPVGNQRHRAEPRRGCPRPPPAGGGPRGVRGGRARIDPGRRGNRRGLVRVPL